MGNSSRERTFDPQGTFPSRLLNLNAAIPPTLLSGHASANASELTATIELDYETTDDRLDEVRSVF